MVWSPLGNMAYTLLPWLPSSLVLHQQLAGFGAGALGRGNRQRLGLREAPYLECISTATASICRLAFTYHMQPLCLFWVCTNQDNRLSPSEWLRSISHHCHTQLDGFTDGKGQVFIPIAEVWGSKAIWEDYHTIILTMKGASTLPLFPPSPIACFSC